MPCTGPEVSRLDVEAAWQETMNMLREKYHIQESRPIYNAERNYGMRYAYNNSLRTALENLFMQQASEDF